jgi:hypothetical protein
MLSAGGCLWKAALLGRDQQHGADRVKSGVSAFETQNLFLTRASRKCNCSLGNCLSTGISVVLAQRREFSEPNLSRAELRVRLQRSLLFRMGVPGTTPSTRLQENKSPTTKDWKCISEG